MKTTFVLLALLASLSSVARAQVILFNDSFNGSTLTTNDGSGSVNLSGNSTTAFAAGNVPVSGSSSVIPTQSSGAFYSPSGQFDLQYLSSLTGSSASHDAYTLASKPVTFSMTVNNITALTNSPSAASPGGGPNTDAGFRWEFGLVTADTAAGANNDLFDNTKGGLYVSLYYDKTGVLQGALREVLNGHPNKSDTAGADLLNLAFFSLVSGSTSGSYTTPLTITFALTTTGYAVNFSDAVTLVSSPATSATNPAVLSGNTLSGTYNSSATLNAGNGLADGVRLNLVGQNWAGTSGAPGTGNGHLLNVEVVPEPGACLLMLTGAVLFFTGRTVFRRLES